VDELVDFQDLDNFDRIKQIIAAYENDIENSDDPDLKMRYHGTLGQIHACGYLGEIEGFSKELSKKHFEQALDNAFLLNFDEDIAQDLNYIHLWYALFQPGSRDEQQAADEAFQHHCHQLQKKQKAQQKNMAFLKKNCAFAAYRFLLQTGLSPETDLESLRLPSNAYWLYAVSNKYIATIEAAKGETDKAKKDFDDALTVLNNSTSLPILCFIRMTILAEAFRSLHEEPYREQALAAVDSLQEQYSLSIEKWRNYLNGTGAFPGLQYWY